MKSFPFFASSSLFTFTLAGCVATTEPTSTEAESAAPLLGVAKKTDCNATDTALIDHAVNAGRFVAVSRAFHQCLRAGVETEANVTDAFGLEVGPYQPQPMDPFRTWGGALQLHYAWYAATSTNATSITCDQPLSGTRIAEARFGTWLGGRVEDEAMKLDDTEWSKAVGTHNGSSATTADFYQAATRMAAAVIWHEAMHAWGYRHPDDPAPGTPLEDVLRAHLPTIPNIVGNCMGHVMVHSAMCQNTCGPNQRPVAPGFVRGNNLDLTVLEQCDCVDDPKLDVGVVLAAGETCPVAPGRHAASTLALSMDDENTSNGSAHAGWIGRTIADSDTLFQFCVVPGARFRRLPVLNLPGVSVGNPATANYAVARMGTTCPAGSVPLSRTFHNESTGNANGSLGHVPPHESKSGFTRLELCMFRGYATSSLSEITSVYGSSSGPFPIAPRAFPSFGAAYGVFGGTALPTALDHGWVFTDDENTANASTLGGDVAGSSTFLTTGSSSTTLRFARVK